MLIISIELQDSLTTANRLLAARKALQDVINSKHEFKQINFLSMTSRSSTSTAGLMYGLLIGNTLYENFFDTVSIFAFYEND